MNDNSPRHRDLMMDNGDGASKVLDLNIARDGGWHRNRSERQYHGDSMHMLVIEIDAGTRDLLIRPSQDMTARYAATFDGYSIWSYFRVDGSSGR